MKTLNTISLILVIIGAVNWGLVGLFEFNIVSVLFGTFSAITRIIYCLIGIAGLVSISLLMRDRTTTTR